MSGDQDSGLNSNGVKCFYKRCVPGYSDDKSMGIWGYAGGAQMLSNTILPGVQDASLYSG